MDVNCMIQFSIVTDMSHCANILSRTSYEQAWMVHGAVVGTEGVGPKYAPKDLKVHSR